MRDIVIFLPLSTAFGADFDTSIELVATSPTGAPEALDFTPLLFYVLGHI